MLDRFEEFTYLISKINKEIQRIKLSELKKYGLKGSQMEFIYYLGKHKELKFKELCEVLNSDKAFVSRTINDLKLKKIILEKYNQDKKALYSLDKKGIEIYELNKLKTEQVFNEVRIDDVKSEELYSSLRELANKLSKIGEK